MEVTLGEPMSREERTQPFRDILNSLNRNFRQTTLTNHRQPRRRTAPNVYPANKVWGDNIRRKKTGDVRICYCNIDGLDTSTTNNVSVKNIRTFLNEKQIDIFGASEVNINWDMMPRGHHKAKEFFRPENDAIKIETAHNIHKSLNADSLEEQ